MELKPQSIDAQWLQLQQTLQKQFGKLPDLEAVLFLIGIQETGLLKNKITKEEKQDLMHVATCTVLLFEGYYEKEHVDAEGWPHFKQLKPLPNMSLEEQEYFLKQHILAYFRNNHILL